MHTKFFYLWWSTTFQPYNFSLLVAENRRSLLYRVVRDCLYSSLGKFRLLELHRSTRVLHYIYIYKISVYASESVGKVSLGYEHLVMPSWHNPDTTGCYEVRPGFCSYSWRGNCWQVVAWQTKIIKAIKCWNIYLVRREFIWGWCEFIFPWENGEVSKR